MKIINFVLIAVLACTILHSCEKDGSGKKPDPIGEIECGGEKVAARYPFCEKASSGKPLVDRWTGGASTKDNYYIGISSIENDFAYSYERSSVYLRLDSFTDCEFDITDESVVHFCFKGKNYTTPNIDARAMNERWKRPDDGYALTDKIPQNITGGKVKVKWTEKSCLLEMSLTFEDGRSGKVSGEIDRDYINKNLGI